MNLRSYIDAGSIGVGNSQLRSLPIAFALVAMATSGFGLRSGAWALDPFFPCCCPVALAIVALLCEGWRHRLSGDLIFNLLSGLIATASRRNLTNNFIAIGKNHALIGLESSRSQHQCLNGLCFRCCSLQRTIRRNSLPKHKFLMHLHARPRPWDDPKQMDGAVLYSSDWADYRRMHSIWQRIFRMFRSLFAHGQQR
jgi:hypothetical protein